jgi:anthranilate/para-aminobenzoate synthase component II
VELALLCGASPRVKPLIIKQDARIAPVPGTPENTQELLDEIRHLDHEIFAIGTTRSYELISQHFGGKNVYYNLIHLNPEEKTLRVITFSKQESKEANEKYTELETTKRDVRHNVALLSASSIAELQRAYPNYFADTARFERLVDRLSVG